MRQPVAFRSNRGRVRRHSVALSLAALLPLLLAACGDDGETTVAPDEGPDATETTVEQIATTTAASGETVSLDDGRVTFAIPDGYVLSAQQSNTGIEGEHLYSARFVRTDPPSNFFVAVNRGNGVHAFFEREPARPSDIQSGHDRELYEAHYELMDTDHVGWRFGADAAVWVSSSDLDVEQMAEISERIEVLS